MSSSNPFIPVHPSSLEVSNSLAKAMPPMEATVEALLAPGKGILAADESLPTIEKRFKPLGIASTEESRRAYRELLFTTPALSECISGVILFDETLRQRTKSGVPMPEYLAKEGIIPGVKVDKGTGALANCAGETVTQGLDGLRERLAEYREMGARFTKWRAVINIGDRLPTRTCIEANALMLALYAGLSQEAGLVPVVEPEVLMKGSHTIAHCEEVMTFVLQSVFSTLFDHQVVLEQMLLKTGMVLSGEDALDPAIPDIVTDATLRCLRRTVPVAVPGIVFLSGGQSDVEATRRLNAICKAGNTPWKLSFSFGRALQTSALNHWKGDPDNLKAAQGAVSESARANSLAIRATDVRAQVKPAKGFGNVPGHSTQ